MNFKAGLCLQISKTSLYLLVTWPCVLHPTSIPAQPTPDNQESSSAVICPSWQFYMNGLIGQVAFCVWLLPLLVLKVDLCCDMYQVKTSFLFFPFNVCVCVCPPVYTSAHVCEYTGLWKSEDNPGCCPSSSVYLSFETGLSLSRAHQVD